MSYILFGAHRGPIFVPAKAIPRNPKDYLEITGGSTDEFARKVIELLPDLPPDGIVHDDSCGPGTITQTVMGSNPPIGTIIKATDIAPGMVEEVADLAEKESWQVETAVMSALDLTFSDNHFSRSFLFFSIFMLPDDGIEAVRHIHRTLRPGGLAIVAAPKSMPFHPVIKEVAEEIRGADRPYGGGIAPRWYQADHLRHVMDMGGFEPAKIQMETVEAWNVNNGLERWATFLWS